MFRPNIDFEQSKIISADPMKVVQITRRKSTSGKIFQIDVLRRPEMHVDFEHHIVLLTAEEIEVIGRFAQ